MKKNKKRNFIVLGIVIVLVACITIMLFQVKGEKKEVVETDQNSYRYIKVDGKDYRYRTNLKTILFLGIDTTDENLYRKIIARIWVHGGNMAEVEFINGSRVTAGYKD